ncbi:MAG: hypothetical protein OER88_08270, partial [Planctomycetota bacterium]|nr:hypothetical protein [Planctomycetota bacterium]
GQRIIWNAVLGKGGRHLFVSTGYRTSIKNRYDDWHVVPAGPAIVDLKTGAIRDLEGESLWFSGPDRIHGHYWGMRAVPQPVVVLAGKNVFDVYDGATGSVRGRGLSSAEAAPLVRDGLRANGWWLPDGSRIWKDGDTMRRDDGVEIPFAKWYRAGYGFQRGAGLRITPHVYFDFTRGKVFNYHRTGVKIGNAWIRPGSWLTKTKDRKTWTRTWWLFDPETRERVPANGLRATDFVCTALRGGTVLVQTTEGSGIHATGPITSVDPETGARRVVSAPMNMDGVQCAEVNALMFRLGPQHTPRGKRLLALYGTDSGLRVARYDAKTNTLALTREWKRGANWRERPPWFIGCPDEDHALFIVDQHEVWKLRFGSDDATRVWEFPSDER